MNKILNDNGLVEIKGIGEKFNPEFHEAIEEVECEKKDQGIILEELRKGYRIGDRVIRATLVKTGKSK
jgi:molecular chaperone GrpE